MKTLLVLGAILSFSFAQLYDSNNDNLDIEGLVSDDSKLKAFMDCFLDTATCDDVSADFKKDLPEAATQACAKCTPAQKHILKRFLEVSKDKIPQDYESLKKKLDPEDKYFVALEEAVANA